MRITYLPEVNENRASSRYRQIIPGAELKALGHSVYGTGQRKNSEWAIINKAVGDEFQKASWTGYNKICFDMCDNHFITSYRHNHMNMCNIADLITCSTEEMKRVIFYHTGRSAVVIEDPYELDIIPPVDVNELKSIFWHGGNLSVPALAKVGEIVPGGITGVVIDTGNELYEFIAVGADKYKWSMNYSESNTIKGLAQSDVCIIPVDDDEWSKCKSPNRLMNAVARGKFVIANHMPAYEPFSRWMFIGDIAKGLSWTKENLKELPSRITSAQDYLIKNHSPQVIGKKWETALSS